MTGGELALLAAALKGFEVYKKNEKSQKVNRQRLRAQKSANEASKAQAQQALAAAKDARDKLESRSVEDSRNTEAKRMGTLLKAIPQEEYAVADPTKIGEPNVITAMKESAKAKGLSDIERYADNKAQLSAATGIANTASVTDANVEAMYKIQEAARRQREIQRLLALKLGEIDPRSLEGEIAGVGGDLALMAAFGA